MNLKNYIDLTILRPDATYDEVKNICEIAIKDGYRSVCIPPIYVSRINSLFNPRNFSKENKINRRNLKIVSVIGFPLGNINTLHKIEEYRKLSLCCDELDIVLPINEIKSKNWIYVLDEIQSLSSHVNFWHTKIKLIIETCYLEEDEIKTICNYCNNNNSIFAIKTSTGFGKYGATVEDIKLIKKYWKREIKASGGIKTKEDAMKMIEAGATIIGTSSIF